MNYEVYIEKNDPVILLSEMIDEIYQTEAFTAESEWNGEIPEDILMKILVYGYMNGAYSSRKIEERRKRDINFLWLLETYSKPDHCMIARFRKKMGEQIEKVFFAIVDRLMKKKEISGDNIFIDGTKIEANANRYTFVWKKAVSKNEQKIRAKLPELLEEIHSSFKVKFPENTPLETMIETLSSLMKKLGIERVNGKGKHKTLMQNSPLNFAPIRFSQARR